MREARRRQRRRWLLGALALVAVGGLVAGLTMSIGSPPPRPSAPTHEIRPPSPTPSGQRVTQPVTPPVTPPASSGPLRLASIAFFDPTSVYGVFTAGSTAACSVDVAATSDGGAQFDPPVAVAPCAHLGYEPALAFDDHGDGFLYSPRSDVPARHP